MSAEDLCAECGARVPRDDLESGIAREIGDALYCRRCLVSFGLGRRPRASETETLLSSFRDVVGELTLKPKASLTTNS